MSKQAGQGTAALGISQDSGTPVEGEVVGGNPRRLTVSGRQGRVPEQVLQVLRPQVGRERQLAVPEVVGDAFGPEVEPKDQAVATRATAAPIPRIGFELEALAGHETDDPEGPGASRSAAPIAVETRCGLGYDRRRRAREHGRKEGERTFELEDELTLGDDMEAGKLAGLASPQSPRSEDRQQGGLGSVSGFRRMRSNE